MPLYPYQRVYTDEEANLRTLKPDHKSFHSCLFCKRLIDATNTCSKKHNVTDCRNQICDEWRYVA